MKNQFNFTSKRFLLLTLFLFVSSSLSLLATPPVLPATQTLADWQRAKEYTKEYLDAMPEDGINFKPTPEMRSFAEQMLHLANGNFNFAAAASGKANPYQGKNLEKMEGFNTKAALTKVVMESYDFVIAALKAIPDAQMSQNIKLFGRDMTREVSLHKLFEHQTHHRGQTTVYLRLKGVKPPQEKLF